MHLSTAGDPHCHGGDWDDGTLAHSDQRLLHRRIVKWREDEQLPTKELPPTFVLIPCDRIKGTCVGFPDILCNNKDNAFFILRKVEEWPRAFEDAALAHLETR